MFNNDCCELCSESKRSMSFHDNINFVLEPIISSLNLSRKEDDIIFDMQIAWEEHLLEKYPYGTMPGYKL